MEYSVVISLHYLVATSQHLLPFPERCGCSAKKLRKCSFVCEKVCLQYIWVRKGKEVSGRKLRLQALAVGTTCFQVLGCQTICAQAKTSLVCNLGNGQCFSVLEMIEAARRPGDPARLVASSQRACEVRGWVLGIEESICSAWKWHQSHPQGYGD